MRSFKNNVVSRNGRMLNGRHSSCIGTVTGGALCM